MNVIHSKMRLTLILTPLPRRGMGYGAIITDKVN